MLKRIFTLWLVLSILGFGTAWPFDGHALVAEHDTPSGYQVHDSLDDGEPAACDHCCHIDAHLMGVWNSGTELIHSARDPFVASPDYHLVSISQPPPLRPPKF